MLNASAQFKSEMNNDNRNFLPYADITLLNGTVLNLTPSEIWEGTFKVEDATSASGKFTIGAAIATKLSFTINNIYDDFSEYDFDKATISAKVGLLLSDGTIEKLQIGMFTVDKPSYNGSTISLVCLDNMCKFNKLYRDIQINYPASLYKILDNACTKCGVYLSTKDFPNSDYIVNSDPSTDTLTFADVVACVAQVAGCFAKCDPDGKLVLSWYDFETFNKNSIANGGQFDKTDKTSYQTGDSANGGNFTDYSSGDTLNGGAFTDSRNYHLLRSAKSFSCSTDDVVITGIKVTEEFKETNTLKKASYLSGTDNYLIEVSGNVLIESGAAKTVCEYLYSKIGGMKFRPISASYPANPIVESGDIGYAIDRKENIYQTLITSRSFTIGGGLNISCDAESPLKNSSNSLSDMTKAVVKAREEAQVHYDSYDLSLKNMSTEIENSSGMYETQQVQTDGSIVYIFHNKKDLASSQIQWKITANVLAVSTDYGETWNAGIDASGDAVLHVLSAKGVNADWIHGGTLYLGGTDNKNGMCLIKDANDNTLVTLDKNGLSLDSSVKIAWDNLSGATDKVTEITKDTVTTDYVNALKIKADSVDAENITGTTIIGKTISGGSISIGSGNFSVNSSGQLVCRGATVYGDIHVSNIYANGTLGTTSDTGIASNDIVKRIWAYNGIVLKAEGIDFQTLLSRSYSGTSTGADSNPVTGITLKDGIVTKVTTTHGADFDDTFSDNPITSIKVSNGIVTSISAASSAVSSKTVSFTDKSGSSHSITVYHGIVTSLY